MRGFDSHPRLQHLAASDHNSAKLTFVITRMSITEFLSEFKLRTEERWRHTALNPSTYGFQFQQGTKWNAGLSVEAVDSYERALNARFPNDFRQFLFAMNGTDLPTIKMNAAAGARKESVGVFSYPRDVEIVKTRIEDIRSNRSEIAAELAGQGFHLDAQSHLIPIFSHRYVVCGPEPNRSPVLSIVVNSVDAIVYGHSLEDYLEKEFLRD
jgi:hypothetical protein